MTKFPERQKILLYKAIHSFALHNSAPRISEVMGLIADTLKVSKASVQKWCYGKEPRPIADIYVPPLAKWAVCKAKMSRQWLRAFLHACDYPVGSLETHLFDSSDRSGPPDIFALCQNANLRLWGHKQLILPSFYSPRSSLNTLIESFLSSEYPGLMLVGASGLGKTSLTLWLASNLSGIDLPVLAYPAGRLDGSMTLSNLITHTLTQHDDHPAPSGAPLTWPLLVIFDGVNESPEMTRLTWQIDRALVDVQELKVLLTFRPESFQIVRRSLTLSEQCYFADLDADLTNYLKVDPPAVHLPPFLAQEVPDIYALYRQAYGLQTPFISLPVSLQEKMRHPLTLRQVAETYTGQTIPDDATVELIPRLLDAFIAQGRLRPSDVHLLEDQLVPLMLGPGCWDNKVPAEKVRKVLAKEGVHQWAPGESGPFIRLADVGLLAPSSGSLDAPVRFAHERFYEHFAYRRLRHLRSTVSDVYAFFADLATAPLFLYGPIRRLLVEEIAQQPGRWTLNMLSSLPTPLAIGALEDWSDAYPSQAHAYLLRLWQLSTPYSLLARLGLPIPEPSLQHRRAQLAIVAATCSANDVDMLQRILLTAGPTAQSAAAVKAANLWQSDRRAAQRLLEHVRQRVINRLGVPNWTAGLAFLQLCLLTMLNHGLHADVRGFLHTQARMVFQRAFGGWQGGLMLRLVTERIAHWIERAMGGDEQSINFDVAFHLSQKERAHLQALASYIDWETTTWDSDAFYEHIRVVVRSGSAAAEWVAFVCLVEHALIQQPGIMVVIKRLLHEASATDSRPPWLLCVLLLAEEALRWHPCTDSELWTLLDDGLVYLLTHYPAWYEAYQTGRSGWHQRFYGPAAGVAPYMLARHSSGLPIDTSPVWQVIQHKLESNDTHFAQNYLREVRFTALTCHQPRLALHLLQPVSRCQDPITQEALANLLAQMHSFAAEDVHGFLEQFASPELKTLANTWTVEPGAHHRMYFGEWFYPFLVEHRSTRYLASEIAAQLGSCNSLREWIRWSAKRLLSVLEKEF